jgi:hypothetical protein
LLPQDPNLLFKVSNIGCHIENDLGFAPTGKPRYLKDKYPIRQLRKPDAISRNSSDTFTPIIQLFQKFTFNPDVISNPLKTALIAHKLSTDASPIHNVSSAY